MNLQIFGVKGDSATRKALRYFSERRIPVHFVDLKQKALSKREIQRFVQKLGIEEVLNREAKRFQNLGLSTAYLSDERWVEKMMDEPLILHTPLARRDNDVTVGYRPETWASWLGK